MPSDSCRASITIESKTKKLRGWHSHRTKNIFECLLFAFLLIASQSPTKCRLQFQLFSFYLDSSAQFLTDCVLAANLAWSENQLSLIFCDGLPIVFCAVKHVLETFHPCDLTSFQWSSRCIFVFLSKLVPQKFHRRIYWIEFHLPQKYFGKVLFTSFYTTWCIVLPQLLYESIKKRTHSI